MQKILGILINFTILSLIIFYLKFNIYIFLLYIILLSLIFIFIFVFVKNINRKRISLLILFLFIVFVLCANTNNLNHKYTNIYQDIANPTNELSEEAKLNKDILEKEKLAQDNIALYQKAYIESKVKEKLQNNNITVNAKNSKELFEIFKDKLNNNLYQNKQELFTEYQNLVRIGVADLDVKDKNTYLLLGNIYEIGFVIGVPDADKFALKSYNKYCELDLNNPECYLVLGKFVSLDKNRHKQAVEYIENAMLLTSDINKREEYQKLLDQIAK